MVPKGVRQGHALMGWALNFSSEHFHYQPVPPCHGELCLPQVEAKGLARHGAEPVSSPCALMAFVSCQLLCV